MQHVVNKYLRFLAYFMEICCNENDAGIEIAGKWKK